MLSRSRARAEADAKFAAIVQRPVGVPANPPHEKKVARAGQLWSVQADQADYRTRTERAMFAAAVRQRRTSAH